MTILLSLILAITGACAVLLLLYGYTVATSFDPIAIRLTNLGVAGEVKSLEEMDLQQPFMNRTIRPLVGRLSRLTRRWTSAGFVSRTEKRLAQGGNPGALRVNEFLGIKVVVATIMAPSFATIFFLLNAGPLVSIAFGAAGVGIGYIAPEFWLNRKISARKTAIRLQLPDVLDLLTISVKAGLGFDAALAKVVEKMHGPLPDELLRTLAEIRLGKSRREAMRDIIPRTEVPALSNFIGAVVQAEQLGVSVSKVLQIQSEQIRIERRQHAEEMAQKAPLKMLFPLIGCIFPSLFIVILGPAMIIIITGLSGTSMP